MSISIDELIENSMDTQGRAVTSQAIKEWVRQNATESEALQFRITQKLPDKVKYAFCGSKYALT